MPIPIPAPLTVPPQPQKVADAVWVPNLTIMAPDPKQVVVASIAVAPWITTTNELVRDQIKQIRLPDLYASAASNPKLAAALQAVYDAVGELVKTLGVFQSPSRTFTS
jgi:hypothetical protein